MEGVCLEFPNPIGDAFSAIQFAPQSNNLLISSWDSFLRLYDVDRSLLRFEAHLDNCPLADCTFKHDTVAFASSHAGYIARYDLHSGRIHMIGFHEDVATCVRYSHETSQVLSGGWDKKIMSLDMRTGTTPAFTRNLDEVVEAMALSGFDLMVAAGTSLHIYDLRKLDGSTRSSETKIDSTIVSVSSIPYSRGYAFGSIDGLVAVEAPSWDRCAFPCHPESKDGRGFLESVNDIVFNPKISGAFITGDNEGYVIAWDAQRKRRLFELPRYPDSVASLSYNYEGQLLAVASCHTYQDSVEKDENPQIFVHKIDEVHQRSVAVGSLNEK